MDVNSILAIRNEVASILATDNASDRWTCDLEEMIHSIEDPRSRLLIVDIFRLLASLNFIKRPGGLGGRIDDWLVSNPEFTYDFLLSLDLILMTYERLA